jgi:hypothetical protein
LKGFRLKGLMVRDHMKLHAFKLADNVAVLTLTAGFPQDALCPLSLDPFSLISGL